MHTTPVLDISLEPSLYMRSCFPGQVEELSERQAPVDIAAIVLPRDTVQAQLELERK
jgi:hypothetical protein